MIMKEILRQAAAGRPDLAATNLGAGGAGIWQHPVKLLRVLKKYPHSSGVFFDVAYLAACCEAAYEVINYG